MKAVLIGNYEPDAQQSMLQFGRMLRDGLAARGVEAVLLQPEASRVAAFVRRLSPASAKWSGYLDKYVLYPAQLKKRLQRETEHAGGEVVAHVVDHSNAVYAPHADPAGTQWIATCHDLLAVRGALGEDTECPASVLGRKLQGAIVRGLARMSAVACDSTSTWEDLERLVPAPGQVRRVIPLGLGHPYQKIHDAEAQARLAGLPGVPWDKAFLVHVGSNLARKNKVGALRVFALLRDRWPGNFVFAGAELTPELRAQAAVAGLGGRVFAVPAPDNGQLEALYNRAHALLFPSKCEGFGWPIIEAQACGCPVICSDRTSLPEVGGDAALVHALEDEAGMAESVLRLEDASFRAAVVARGFANLQRFAVDRMIDGYREVYEEVLAASGRR